MITLAVSAGAGATAFRWTTFASNVHIERIGISLKNGGPTGPLGQIGLRFAELRASRVIDCWIEGLPGSDDTTAIQFDGPGTYTGDVTVDRCYITNHKIGVNIQGVCTTVRVVNCELYGTSGATGTKGVNIASTSFGTLISGCTFDQWVRGVYSEGGHVKQIGNYFESNTPQFEWVRGGTNARVWNQSFGDMFEGTGVPIYPINDWDACFVASGPGYFTMENTVLQSTRGYGSMYSQYSTPPLTLGGYRLWVDASGRLRIKNGAPASDTDGQIVGTQT
jgi:hypothetical protein